MAGRSSRAVRPASDGSIASRGSPWYDRSMEATPFDLTPAQKDLLASLSRETGKPVPALIAEALAGLREHVHAHQVKGETQGSDEDQAALPLHAGPKPIWERFIEAFQDAPDEELERLPVDGAAQHDHYIYGLPKRSA